VEVPLDATARAELATALASAGRTDEAIVHLEAAIALKPDFSRALIKLGQLLAQRGRTVEAVTRYRAALAYEPRNASLHNVLGIALRALGHHEEALASYRLAVALRPDMAAAHYNLANLLRQLRRFEEAMAAYEKALALSPDDSQALNAYAYLCRQMCAWRDIEAIEAKLVELVRVGRGEVTPFSFLPVTDDPALQLACARQYWVRQKVPATPRPAAARSPDRLRLAYVSGDFGDHPVAYLAAEMFALHDRRRFEVFAFSHGDDKTSATRQRLERAFDRFVDVYGASSDDIARQMAAAEIDIAIDLMGHTRGNRLDILARRPAPVQVHYLGFPGTLGVDFIDYMLVDSFVVPPELEAQMSEKLAFLPGSFFIGDSARSFARPRTRQDAGLPASGFVFYAIGNGYKITPPLFDIWMRLLRAVPGSVLWLLDDNPLTNANLRREATARGIDAVRLVFAPRLAPAEHLARHRLADLFLDTVPYNAGTTANDALFIGLPLVTCAGRSIAARMAASQLRAAGIPELVTADLDAYEKLALHLATHADELAALRAKLALNRATSPLFDTARATRAIEAAYLQMWEIHQRGEPPRSFAVAT
jgi:protein O-GlcNAc transferase